jgi:maleylacetoacetate isomerase
MKLYDYFRSSASYRVRIALNIKKMHYDIIPVHLLNQGGEQNHQEYLSINPAGLVPTLDENGHILTQSLAIIEYLDEISPTPPLLPHAPLGRAQVRSLALSIACDIHPINSLRVLNELKSTFQATDEAVKAWIQHWIIKGFTAFEKKLETLPRKQDVCFGQELSIADICLIPQVFNAHRFEVDMRPFPLIERINTHCLTLQPFLDAVPTG